MKIKVFKNVGGSLVERGNRFVAITGVDAEQERDGWTLGMFAGIDGNHSEMAWHDMAAGEFYDYEPVKSEDAEIVIENIGGTDYILEMAKARQ
ncbi:hypothetical protein DCC39_18045 [Pueribacillus theae]|uniref:Uncharacterized protein n=1 Tax=Pueribacillus theae TaxID=2171751 RepID=A0A2U1JKT4_9BACI|nr:hypothetical protein [Pueribacillus theae]PWA05488.1 hypothetical protein DCC39_18045 [Pueribacillus theae]